MGYYHNGSILVALMPTLTIKNVPEAIYQRLKESAKLHRRSLNGEVIARLDEALIGGRLNPDSFLAEVRELRSSLGDLHLTDKEIAAAKASGRP